MEECCGAKRVTKEELLREVPPKPVKEQTLANIDAEMSGAGGVVVTKLNRFLNANIIAERLGAELYKEWTRGPHMFLYLPHEVPMILYHPGTPGALTEILFAEGKWYPRLVFMKNLARAKVCGIRLGQLMKKRRTQLREEEDRKKMKKCNFVI